MDSGYIQLATQVKWPPLQKPQSSFEASKDQHFNATPPTFLLYLCNKEKNRKAEQGVQCWQTYVEGRRNIINEIAGNGEVGSAEQRRKELQNDAD
jgi:hypothetical protein